MSLLRARGAPAKERSTPHSRTGDIPLDEALTDSELASLAREKDPRAATLVWDRYSGLVRGVLHRSLGPGHEVEDLLQDVFVGFFKSVSSLRDVGPLKPFLVGITVRTALTELRKRRVRRWLRLTSDGTMPDVAAPDEDPRAKEALRRLYTVLDELPGRERLAFVLRHAEGHELTETAALLGVSLATIKRVLRRAEDLVESRARDDDLLCAWTERRNA